MDTNFENNKNNIAGKIQSKIPTLKCPACSESNFILAEGYFAHDLQEDLINRRIGGKNVPIVPIICKNCGFIMEFSAGILDILPKENKE
jgi:RNase P subunit RPR2